MNFLFVLSAVCLTFSVGPRVLQAGSCPTNPLLMQMKSFRIIDEDTGKDLDKVRVYFESHLTIQGLISTAAPVTSDYFTASIRAKLFGVINFFGIKFIVEQTIDCPVDSMTNPSDSTQCLVVGSCDYLEALLGVDTFTCPEISGDIAFHASNLKISPAAPGTIPAGLTNNENPTLQMKVEIFDDHGSLISCIEQNVGIDVESKP